MASFNGDAMLGTTDTFAEGSAARQLNADQQTLGGSAPPTIGGATPFPVQFKPLDIGLEKP